MCGHVWACADGTPVKGWVGAFFFLSSLSVPLLQICNQSPVSQGIKRRGKAAFGRRDTRWWSRSRSRRRRRSRSRSRGSLDFSAPELTIVFFPSSHRDDSFRVVVCYFRLRSLTAIFFCNLLWVEPFLFFLRLADDVLGATAHSMAGPVLSFGFVLFVWGLLFLVYPILGLTYSSLCFVFFYYLTVNKEFVLHRLELLCGGKQEKYYDVCSGYSTKIYNDTIYYKI